MRAVAILVVCLLARNSLQRVQFYEEKKISDNKYACMNKLIDELTLRSSNLMIFSTDISYPETLMSNRSVTNFNKWSKLRDTIFVKSGSIAIFLEGVKERDFELIGQLKGAVVVNPVLMVCIANAICNSKMYMEEILETLSNAKLRYAAVDANETINLYEYTLLAEGKCWTPQFKRIGTCLRGFTADGSSEPTMNFHKCPLRVITCNTPPYSMDCSQTSPDLSFHYRCGIERMILDWLVYKLNATYEIDMVGEPNDIRRLLANRQADIGFGKLDNRPYNGIVSSFPHLFVHQTVAASISFWDQTISIARMLIPFRTVVSSIKIYNNFKSLNTIVCIYPPLFFKVWLAVAMAFLTTFTFVKLMPGFGKIGILQIYGAFIMQPIPPVIPRRTFIRIYLIPIIVGGYLCTQAYLANLTKGFVMNPKYTINTLQDLEDSDIQVTGYSDGRTGFKNDFPRIYAEYKIEDYPMYFYKLKRLSTGELDDEALLIEETFESIDSWRGARALENSIGQYGVGFLMPNTSVLREPIDRIIITLLEHGIVTNIQKIAFSNSRMKKSENSPVVISLKKFRSVFYILIIGLAISFFVFLIELAMPILQEKFKSQWK
ncbi:uncharacterized protein LOC125499771 [Athalia rosae]|uniref:uncharacterized protein LOC125499771 n=1 Tax=Athalia rosae TaxID=37344 RepID=UPI0020340900|nr:uncharacterized protein LOC125499771 [Athalia rosae]